MHHLNIQKPKALSLSIYSCDSIPLPGFSSVLLVSFAPACSWGYSCGLDSFQDLLPCMYNDNTRLWLEYQLGWNNTSNMDLCAVLSSPLYNDSVYLYAQESEHLNIAFLLNPSCWIVTTSSRFSFLDFSLIYPRSSPVLLLLPSFTPWSFSFGTDLDTGRLASRHSLPSAFFREIPASSACRWPCKFLLLNKFIQRSVAALTPSESLSVGVRVIPIAQDSPELCLRAGWGSGFGRGLQHPCGVNWFISLCENNFYLFACLTLLLPSSAGCLRKLVMETKIEIRCYSMVKSGPETMSYCNDKISYDSSTEYPLAGWVR